MVYSDQWWMRKCPARYARCVKCASQRHHRRRTMMHATSHQCHTVSPTLTSSRAGSALDQKKKKEKRTRISQMTRHVRDSGSQRVLARSVKTETQGSADTVLDLESSSDKLDYMFRFLCHSRVPASFGYESFSLAHFGWVRSPLSQVVFRDTVVQIPSFQDSFFQL